MTSLSETQAQSWLAIGGRWRKPAVVIGLIVLADWLFFQHAVGISAVIFAAAVAAGVVTANGVTKALSQVAVAGVVLIAAAVPVAIAPTQLALAILVLATAHFALAVSDQTGARLIDRIGNAAQLVSEAAWRWAYDLALWLRNRDREEAPAETSVDGSAERPKRRRGVLVAWIVPVTLGATFLLLFRSANPLVERWFDDLDLRSALAGVSPRRIFFWLGIVVLVWPMIFLKWRSGQTAADWAAKALSTLAPPLSIEPAAAGNPPTLFGKTAILRSLVLFNLMFAVQTAMDLAFLWGGLALPEGLSYAAYAHRGAYPLIATALLAAVFVLAAMRPGSETARSRTIRVLVFLWVGQNVLLVISSMLRLDLYIAVYSLTDLRVAAFIWMGLVTAGLLLIVARIALNRSNAWLFGMNLSALSLTLYLCGFVNFPSLIADYNVDHSLEMSGEGRALDVDYLVELGPQALPALDRFIAHRGTTWWRLYAENRGQLISSYASVASDWRAWSVRNDRLAHYLRDQAGNDAGED